MVVAEEVADVAAEVAAGGGVVVVVVVGGATGVMFVGVAVGAAVVVGSRETVTLMAGAVAEATGAVVVEDEALPSFPDTNVPSVWVRNSTAAWEQVDVPVDHPKRRLAISEA